MVRTNFCWLLQAESIRWPSTCFPVHLPGALGTEAVNAAAQYSAVMDTDYAVETTNMLRNQILQQAGSAMLAQANQVPNGVLALLR